MIDNLRLKLRTFQEWATEWATVGPNGPNVSGVRFSIVHLKKVNGHCYSLFTSGGMMSLGNQVRCAAQCALLREMGGVSSSQKFFPRWV